VDGATDAPPPVLGAADPPLEQAATTNSSAAINVALDLFLNTSLLLASWRRPLLHWPVVLAVLVTLSG